MKVVAVVADQRDEQGIKGSPADEPPRIGLAAIARPVVASGVLAVDPKNRWQFDMPPLPHRHGRSLFAAGCGTVVEEPLKNVRGPAWRDTIAAEHAPAKLMERRRDSRSRQADQGPGR